MDYEDFKKAVIEATEVINKAKEMRAVSDDFAEGFAKAMWEARKIYMHLEAELQESGEEDRLTSADLKLDEIQGSEL